MNTKRLCLSFPQQLPLQYAIESSFSHKKFLIMMICMLTAILIDVSLVRVYDLVDKGFASTQAKVILFAINSSICLSFGFIITRYVWGAFRGQRLRNKLHIDLLYRISFVSFFVVGGLMSILVFQMYFDKYYERFISMLIIAISYGIAASFVIKLALLFMSWYESSRNVLVQYSLDFELTIHVQNNYILILYSRSLLKNF
jgi:hypothetical protein